MEVNATIGIVNDSANGRAALKKYLTVYKYRVIVEAKNGKDLIDKMTSALEIPTICFVDASMPVMDGCETVTKLKESFPLIKIVAFSIDEILGHKMVKLGAAVYLPKHSKEEAIIECIEKLLKI